MRILRAGLLTATLGAVLGFLAVPGVAGTPLGDFSGGWSGKLAYRDQVIDVESGSGERGSMPATLWIWQEGISVEGVLTLQGDDGQETFFCEGRAGNGRFWLRGSSESGSVTIVGAGKGAVGRRAMKGKGAYTSDEVYSDIKLSLREDPEVTEPVF